MSEEGVRPGSIELTAGRAEVVARGNTPLGACQAGEGRDLRGYVIAELVPCEIIVPGHMHHASKFRRNRAGKMIGVHQEYGRHFRHASKF